MLKLIIFILVCYGLTQILIYGKIFDKIRPKAHFFKCSMCVGFHISWIMFLIFWFSGIQLFPNPYVGWFLFGCLGSGTSYALSCMFGDDGINISK